jgi:hypothetical protein
MYLKKSSELGIQTNMLIGSAITSEYSQKKNWTVRGNTLVILPSLAGFEVEEERIVVDESGGDSLVQELGMPIKNKNKITNYSSLRILLH